MPTDTAAVSVAPLPPPSEAAAGSNKLLRLVRLRLVLALIAMATVPLVLVSVIPGLLQGAQPADQERLGGGSATLASNVSVELERVRDSLVTLAADPAIAQAPSGDAAAAKAQARLQAAATTLGPTITSAALLDRAGDPVVAASGSPGGAPIPTGASGAPSRSENPAAATATGATAAAGSSAGPSSLDALDARILRAALALKPGAVYASDGHRNALGQVVVTLATPVAASGSAKPQAVLRYDVAVMPLLAVAGAAPVGQGGYSLLVDSRSGEILADTRGFAAASAGEGTGTGLGGLATTISSLNVPGLSDALNGIVNRTGRAWSTFLGGGLNVGFSGVASTVPALADLSVVVAEPAAGAPIPMVALLLLLVATLVLLTFWMARQVLRPAQDLERARSQLGRLYESARTDALHDLLTGLGNHRAFQEEFDRQLDASRRYSYPMSLIVIDLDDFKIVNDSAGHAAGDELLANMGRILVGQIRRSDRAFRTGGDEFAVLLPHTDAAGAEVMGRRLLSATLSPQGRAAGRPFSFSAGIASAPAHGTNRSELYAAADAALYWAKRHGRTAVEVFDPQKLKPRLDATESAQLSAAVADVAVRRALRPVYQPIVELATGRIVGYEGLVRPLPDTGFSNPGALFSAAEATGRTVELDQACAEVVVGGFAEAPDGLVLSLNLSPRTLEAPEFNAGVLLNILKRNGISPGRLILELTERETVEDLARLRQNMLALQAAGARVAADDVGAGNAGLRLLSQIHFDIVKIDLSLVQAGTQHENALAVVTTLRDLAARWGAMVIAEGVETPEQLRTMRALGVAAAQGYLLGRPGESLAAEPIDLDVLAAVESWTPENPFVALRNAAAGTPNAVNTARTPVRGAA